LVARSIYLLRWIDNPAANHEMSVRSHRSLASSASTPQRWSPRRHSCQYRFSRATNIEFAPIPCNAYSIRGNAFGYVHANLGDGPLQRTVRVLHAPRRRHRVAAEGANPHL